MKLNYTATNIAKVEEEANVNFFDMLSSLGDGTISFSKLTTLIKMGGITEENEIDKILKKGLDNALIEIMEGIDKSGFLPTKLDIEAMKEDVKNRKEQALVNTGLVSK